MDVNSDGGLYLCCECDTGILDNHGEKIWTPNSFPLHDYFHVAVDQPKIRYGKGGGYAITDSNHFDRYDASLVGSSILKAKVRAGSGSWQYASTCLDFFFTNKLGFLTCDKPYVFPFELSPEFQQSMLMRAVLNISVPASP